MVPVSDTGGKPTTETPFSLEAFLSTWALASSHPKPLPSLIAQL